MRSLLSLAPIQMAFSDLALDAVVNGVLHNGLQSQLGQTVLQDVQLACVLVAIVLDA